VVEKLKKKDPRYEERVAASRQERQERLQCRLVRALPPQELFNTYTFEVCGAGSDDVNGSYVAGVLPTYVGPTVYRKPNTYLFIYRWHQTQWVIAELRGPYSMGYERAWLYCAPTQPPNDIPPVRGWEVQQRWRARSPAPNVHAVRAVPRSPDGSAAQRHRTPPRSSEGTGPSGTHDDEAWPSNGVDDAQARCRCAPSCSVM